MGRYKDVTYIGKIKVFIFGYFISAKDLMQPSIILFILSMRITLFFVLVNIMHFAKYRNN